MHFRWDAEHTFSPIREFNDMPTFMATQNFQWYEKIKRLQE